FNSFTVMFPNTKLFRTQWNTICHYQIFRLIQHKIVFFHDMGKRNISSKPKVVFVPTEFYMTTASTFFRGMLTVIIGWTTCYFDYRVSFLRSYLLLTLYRAKN